MNIFKRAIMWTAMFYVINTISIFYITNKSSLRDFDALLFLLPIFVWACATEIWGKRFKKQKFYVYGIINSALQAVAMVFAMLIYNKTATGAWYYVCLVLFFMLVISSSFMIFLIVKCEKQYYQSLTDDRKQ